MLIPYRAKNPPEHFPFVTLGLIVINCAIFALTSEKFWRVRDEVVDQYAVSLDTLSFLRLTTAMFLHADPLHLLGNMLFLWIFGTSVEGRMRPLPFIIAYLIAGYAGGLLQLMALQAVSPSTPSLGASGAIMGVAGMYLYIFPYALICAVHRQYWVLGWPTVSDIQARWVILYFVGFDLLYQFLFHGKDGVGHLAHLGGFAAGLAAVFILRVRRDSEQRSIVKATQAEMKDYSLLSFRDLSTLMEHPTEDMRLVMTYCEKAILDARGAYMNHCLKAARGYIQPLMEQADPDRLAWVLLSIPASQGGVPPIHYIRLASKMESTGAYQYAAQLYRRVYELFPSAPDTETALYRLARLTERTFNNPQQARALYAEMLRLFPNGQMALDVRRHLQVQ
jgi:membrane associated rhomboid family serine protease